MNAGRARLLRQCFGSLSEVAAASPSSLAALLKISESDAAAVRSPFSIPEIRRKVEAQSATAITLADDDYPPLLAEIHDPPAVLHYRGDPKLLSAPSIAIVGSRRASPYGVNAARRLARDLTSAGLTVVSGFARGIDAAAHDETAARGGSTVAVLGTGIDIDYPRGQRKLRERIEQCGVVVSEFPPGHPPHAMNFPVRNRIIAGLCLGTVVVEASARSGSLITARLASEEGREVFAVPGPIFSRSSEGTHRLIQSGAKLVHSVEDILEELGGQFAFVAEHDERRRSEDERRLLDALDHAEPRHVDQLAAAVQWSSTTLAEVLLRLEMSAAIRALPGQRYVRSG